MERRRESFQFQRLMWNQEKESWSRKSKKAVMLDLKSMWRGVSCKMIEKVGKDQIVKDFQSQTGNYI